MEGNVRFIRANIIRYEPNGFNRLQPVWSNGLVNVEKVQKVHETYAPEGVDGKMCVLKMFDGTEVCVKNSLEEIEKSLGID